MVEYVLGFCFSPNHKSVALIRKNRPDWQAGLLNGIGGHIEPEETPEQAMEREFLEETGAEVEGWTPFAIMDFPDTRVYCYHNVCDPAALKTMTDEPVEVHEVDAVISGNRFTVPNLRWLVNMALIQPKEHYKVLRIMHYTDF